MRDTIYKNEALRRALQELGQTVAAAAALLADEGRVAELEELSGHDGKVCRRVWELCAPYLEEDGVDGLEWLSALCDRLSDNMFPDGAHPRRELTGDEQLYLAVLEQVLEQNLADFDPLSVVLSFPQQAMQQSRVAAEYSRYRQAIAAAHVLPLMRISREIRPFDPASHTIGVHNVALHTAILAAKAGVGVDLPLVSAAAFGHDIGKFGCRGDDARRIPYLHYYYTWQWFSEQKMEEIGHVSANHSTWDLEFENLPVESLLLIYADFRVRGTRGEDGKEKICIYTLAEAYE